MQQIKPKCNKCNSEETEYDYDKINDIFIIKCKKCKNIISSQNLKGNYQNRQKFSFSINLDKKTFIQLLIVIGVIIIVLFLGSSAVTLFDRYQQASMDSIMNINL